MMNQAMWRVLAMLVLGVSLAACGETSDQNQGENKDTQNHGQKEEKNENEDQEKPWSTLVEEWPAAFLSVGGQSASDFWVVGARVDGSPQALHFQDGEPLAHEVPFDVDLWWVHVTSSGKPFFGGSDGAIVSFDGYSFERIDELSLARHTVFGLTGEQGDLYAVGGIGARSGFVWHHNGETWRNLPLPADLPPHPDGTSPGIFKAFADGQGTVWFVGAQGTVLRRVGEGPLERIPVDTEATLFTVHGAGDVVYAAGGLAGGGVLVRLGDEPVVEQVNTPFLQGVHVSENGDVVAAGGSGWTVVRKADEPWEEKAPALDAFVESLHAVWTAPDGLRVAVGGSVVSPELDEGLILVQGEAPLRPSAPERRPDSENVQCPQEVLERGAEQSVARRWVEQNLAAIRLEIPQPTVHSRNLYHLSLTLFEAWALFDDAQHALVVGGQVSGLDPNEFTPQEWELAREETMSLAAHRLLTHRYGESIGGPRTRDCLDRVLEDLGYDPSLEREERGSAGRLGVDVAEAVIAEFREDGALEALNYQDPNYEPPAGPLVVDDPGTDAMDPTVWQPLDLAQAVTQNGIAVEAGLQGYIGPHWRQVRPFALERPGAGLPYIEPGARPELGPEMDEWVLDVIRRTSWLDIQSSERMDASPGSYGNNSLGADDGQGHAQNPLTGEPYPTQIVSRSNFGRVLAEFWADGPNSETPPGHWNTLAHQAMDHPLFERRFYGEADEVDALTYDVHLHLVLNGALHDAAIVAWELKRHYETARPITLIRWKGAQGQSSDPELPSFHPDGLPLVEGLVEVVTEESSAPGERHEHLRPYMGQVVLFTWPGAPGDYENRSAPCTWQRAVEWSPYQPRTFVSPAFPGYVSGHSTFSRSAAQVLAELTGSAFFPGGLAEFVARENEYLEFEKGPSQEVRLQWATYFDAADQAGQSRIWGGIHIAPDDYDGRRFGAEVGLKALDWAADNVVLLRPSDPN